MCFNLNSIYKMTLISAFLDYGYKKQVLESEGVDSSKKKQAQQSKRAMTDDGDTSSTESNESARSTRKKGNSNGMEKVEMFMKECKNKKDQSSNCNTNAKYQCQNCTFTTNDDNKFSTHVSKTHGKVVYCCVTEGFVLWFLSQNGLRQHCKKLHANVLKCDVCDLVLLSPSLLNAHKDTARTAKKGVCPSCNKTFSRADDAKRHHLKNCPKNPDRITRCKQCLKEGDEVDVPGTELGLLNHLIKVHYCKGDFLCVYCHRVFDADRKITAHHQKCTKNKPEK